jgi:hypothetical protein
VLGGGQVGVEVGQVVVVNGGQLLRLLLVVRTAVLLRFAHQEDRRCHGVAGCATFGSRRISWALRRPRSVRHGLAHAVVPVRCFVVFHLQFNLRGVVRRRRVALSPPVAFFVPDLRFLLRFAAQSLLCTQTQQHNRVKK